MSVPRNTAEGCRRRSGRIVQEALLCNLGVVVDISKGGMRLRCETMPERFVEVVFQGVDLPWRLSAEFSWARLIGDEYEVGLRFLDLTPQQESWLGEIAFRYSLDRQLP